MHEIKDDTQRNAFNLSSANILRLGGYLLKSCDKWLRNYATF